LWQADQAFPHMPPLRLGRDLDIDILQQRDEDALVDLVLESKERLVGSLQVWVDDSRPAPPGWLRITTVRNAKRLLEARLVREMSLDYDLGWCAECLASGEHLKSSGRRHCEHTPTGYDLVHWMAETEHWTLSPPTVHSGNIEGGARMLGVIARYWHEEDGTRIDGAPDAPPPGLPAPVRTGAIGPEAVPVETVTANVATLTTCPRCHGPYLYRTHRNSTLQRLRSLVTRRYPVRCNSCGWAAWAKDPILVRMTSATTDTKAAIESERLERIDPD
jgi:hypothetical protein